MSERAIWKFPLAGPHQGVVVPVGARVLAAQAQRGVPCLWMLVDPEAPTETRVFIVAGTGHSLPHEIERAPYIGTVQIGEMVWHIFEGHQ